MGRTLNITCQHCGKEHLIKNRLSSKSLYCSVQCQQDFLLKIRVVSGVAKSRTVKRFLLKEYGNGCWECGIDSWNGKEIVLELEHKDGNSDNNALENLALLCPNCHSQTSTYKSKNIGKGRHFRRVRYSEGKSF